MFNTDVLVIGQQGHFADMFNADKLHAVQTDRLNIVNTDRLIIGLKVTLQTLMGVNNAQLEKGHNNRSLNRLR